MSINTNISNITIAPNICSRSSVNIQNDDEFVKQVYGYKALNILKTRFPKSYATRFTRAQIEEMKQNVICRLGKTREHAYGKAMSDGRMVWSCRCEHTTCHAYEKCMSLPNALRIDRAQHLHAPDGANDSGGFDPDDCNFEPAHVSVILPILNEILSEPIPEMPGISEIPETLETLETQQSTEVIESPAPVFADTLQLTQTIPTPNYTHESQQSLGNAVKIAEVAEINPETTESHGEHILEKPEPVPEPVNKLIYPHMAEKCEFDVERKALVICENVYEAGFFSTILYRNKVKHRSLCADGYTLNRRIADVFWDYCGDEIEREAFFDRCLVRLDGDESVTEEFYNALFKICGSEQIGESGGIKVADLADSLNESPELIDPCILNMDDPDCPVTLSTIEALSPDDEFDDLMLLEGQNILVMHTAIQEIFDAPPTIIQKESLAGWVFNKSALGRPCRISLDNYRGVPGRRCLNVELGLWGDVDGKSFLAEQMGDAIRLQLYIAEKIKEGDELTVGKDSDTGSYRFFHNGNLLGEFPEAIIREVRAIEGFPDDFAGLEGLYVRNIVTCISEKGDNSVPAQFRESRIWLGLDITGYAKVLI